MDNLNNIYNEILKIELKKSNPGFFEKNKKITLIATPEYIHKEFKKTYGGESDSDDEDYNNLFKKPNKK
jgi:hypothetical protein